MELRCWSGHSYEAWTVASDKWSGDVIYSG